MDTNVLKKLSDEELLAEAKKAKQSLTYGAVFMGALIGIAIYSSVTNGFGLLTFLPLLYLPMASKNQKQRNAIQTELSERGLS